MTDEPAAVAPVLFLTDQARQTVLDARAAEPDAEHLALWVEITGAAGAEYAYDIYFQPVEEATADDWVQRHDDLSVVVPAASVDRLQGSTLGMSRDQSRPGMAITNPNRPATPPAPPPPVGGGAPAPTGDLSGEVAQRVLTVLQEEINPAIASHGGQAELVAVDDDVAYLRLSGGCQGCGMAAVTLSQGIEVAIRDAVPEITRVVDVTDHASGANPYFEAAKK